MLFAVHPIQVEPVAWVTGFRDLLCGLFSLLAIHQYIVAFDLKDDARQHRALHAVAAVLAYLAAMLCKPTAACLPLVLAAIDYLLLRRPARRVVVSVVPMMIAAIPVVIISRMAQPTELQAAAAPLWSRPFIAGDALMFYLWKLFIPLGLAMDYGRRPQIVLAHQWIYASWIIPAAAGIVIWILSRRGAQYLVAGAAIMLAALLPVLGLIPFNFQAFSTVADRYMYLAMLGPAVALTGFLSKQRGLAACGLATALVLMLGIVAHRQVWVWRDDTMLYPHTIAINPDSFTANNNLAAVLLERGRPTEAIEPARRAVRISPGFALAWINLADALAAVGRDKDAINAYRTALTIQPNHAAARAKMALALASAGDIEAARQEYERAVRDDPNQRAVELQLEQKIRAPH